MKSVFVEKNNIGILIFTLVLITMQMCLCVQVTFANEFATSTEETVVVPASVVEIEVLEPVIVVEPEKLPELLPTNIVNVSEDILDNKDVAQIKIQKEEEFKRSKIEPVDAPLHSSFKKAKTFPFLKLEENKKAIDKPQLPPRTLFRLYGIVASTSAKEVVAAVQEIEPTTVNIVEVVGTTTASTSSSSPIVLNTEEVPATSDAASSTDNILLDIELPVFIKPEEAVERKEEVANNE
jgi:hypothetical protein